MRRRDFITSLAGAAAWISVSRAQEPRYVISYLSGSSDAGPNLGPLAAFRKGLKETGFVEGRNINIEFRFADGRYDRLPSLAAELVARVCDFGGQCPVGICCEGGDQDDPHCLYERRGPGQSRSRRKFESTEQQPHWREHSFDCFESQTC